ncbi:glyoxalase superfamily protein [Herbiconiux sp. L3-i23]|uniref:glyoxalase superfamily protein n=1 Tax=Herbiconiux sp. L3-i23 TaxID=2905871 RepID=UPI002055D452|nr:glyoxalase superfamily protein [Herbiconiux sp. L3-i23]BDI22211.1 hypothetical protein L3i23_09870 [Herbiconiux sp. L3-i23]
MAPSHRGAWSSAIPVLRIGDETVARRFYVEGLRFAVVFEHRFAPGLPLYLRVHRDGCVLDLSMHAGDGPFGGAVWLTVPDVHAVVAELNASGIRHSGVDEDAPGGPTVDVSDPFGNVLRLCQSSGVGNVG